MLRLDIFRFFLSKINWCKVIVFDKLVLNNSKTMDNVRLCIYLFLESTFGEMIFSIYTHVSRWISFPIYVRDMTVHSAEDARLFGTVSMYNVNYFLIPEDRSTFWTFFPQMFVFFFYKRKQFPVQIREIIWNQPLFSWNFVTSWR